MKSGQLYQADMADLALTAASIPHFLREETSSGLRLAMPLSPTMGPGNWWVILVPKEHANDALKVLNTLPFEITTNPDVWDCQSSELGRKRIKRVFLLFLLLLWLGVPIAFLLIQIIFDPRR